MEKALAINIYGLVQGVGFRYQAQKMAIKLGLSGWVKNLADGSIYIECRGNQSELDQFVAWCHLGPAGAKVSSVNSREILLKDFSGFKILFD